MEGAVSEGGGGGVGVGEAMEERVTPFLSQPPRSGELSTFAQKLFGEMFVWLASMVVFGSTINQLVATGGGCGSLCGYAIATAVISTLVTSLLLFGHWLTWSSKMDQGSWFNSTTEKTFMGFLVVWWAAGVGGLSAVVTEPYVQFEPVRNSSVFDNLSALNAPTNITATFTAIPLKRQVTHASSIGIFFGWLAFFGSIYTTFKSYHASKEEQKALSYSSAFPFSQGEALEEEHYANF